MFIYNCCCFYPGSKKAFSILFWADAYLRFCLMLVRNLIFIEHSYIKFPSLFFFPLYLIMFQYIQVRRWNWSVVSFSCQSGSRIFWFCCCCCFSFFWHCQKSITMYCVTQGMLCVSKILFYYHWIIL